MKQQLRMIVLIAVITLSKFNAYAQVSVPSNAGLPANYVGWNAAQLFPLIIQHKGAQPINFWTNNIHRMTILDGTGGASSGFVGIGNGFTDPKSRLHLHQLGNNI